MSSVCIYLSIWLSRKFQLLLQHQKSSSRCSILHQFYNLQSPINNVVPGVNRRKKRKKKRKKKKVDKSWGQISDDALQHCTALPYNYRNGVSSLLYTDWVWQHWKDRHTDTQTNGMEQQWSISVRLLLIYERHTQRERENILHARTHSFSSSFLRSRDSPSFRFFYFLFFVIYFESILFLYLFCFYYHLMVTFIRTHFRSLEAFSISFLFYLSLCGGMLNLVNDSDERL